MVKKNNRFPCVLLAVTLAVALLFGAVFGILVGVRYARAVVRYGSLTVDADTYAYLASCGKAKWVAKIRAGGIAFSDDEAFYAREGDDGVTYGDALCAYVEGYVREVLVTASLYDRYASLSSSDRKTIREATAAVLDYRAGGDRTTFDRMAQTYGFTYRGFENAATLLYKASQAGVVIYGSDGGNMQNLPEECNDYLASAYVHVKLCFIRTQTKFYTDEYGNRVRDEETGQDKIVELSKEERAQRRETIDDMNRAIGNLVSGGDGAMMTDTMFDTAAEKFDDNDAVFHTLGYYFLPGGSYTEEFTEAFPEVMAKVMTMKIGEYASVAYGSDNGSGVCFISCLPAQDGAYASDSLSDMFSGFYARAATVVHNRTVAELSPGVVLTEKYNAAFPLSVPYNTELLVRF